MPDTLVCLHGWGGSAESFTELREALARDDITILTPDLPGFGNEPEPSAAYTTDDYARWVADYLSRHAQGSYALLGHSHGGRIAIKLVTGNYNCPKPNHLYLCAAAGIRHPRHFKRAIGLTLAKTGKLFLQIPGLKQLQPLAQKLLYRLVRVHDYERASPVMRQTLINVSREDLRPLLPHINVSTDIIWGEQDGMTPVSDAHVMARAIPDNDLHIFPGIRHRVHRDKATDIADIIRRHQA